MMKCPFCFDRLNAKKYVKEQIPVVTKKEAEANGKIMLLGGLAIGFTAGVLAGTVAAVLSAPKSEAKTCCDLAAEADDAADGVKESPVKMVEKVKNAAGEAIGKVKDKITGFDDEDVVVEYTIRYGDEGEAEECCCCSKEPEEAEEAVESEEAEAPAEEAPEAPAEDEEPAAE